MQIMILQMLFGDRLVVFDGESKNKVEERFIGTLTEIMRTSDSDSNLVKESWNYD